MARPRNSPADCPTDSIHDFMDSAARSLISSSAAFMDLIWSISLCLIRDAVVSALATS